MVAWFVIDLILTLVFIGSLVYLTQLSAKTKKHVDEEIKSDLDEVLNELESNGEGER